MTEVVVNRVPKQGIPLVNTKAWSNAIGLEDRARRQYAVYSCSLPNVVLYDFVNQATSQEIIGLRPRVVCDIRADGIPPPEVEPRGTSL